MNKKQIKLLKTVEINLHYAHEAMRELNKDIFSDEGQEYPVPFVSTEKKPVAPTEKKPFTRTEKNNPILRFVGKITE